MKAYIIKSKLECTDDYSSLSQRRRSTKRTKHCTKIENYSLRAHNAVLFRTYTQPTRRHIPDDYIS